MYTQFLGIRLGGLRLYNQFNSTPRFCFAIDGTVF